MSSRGQAPNPRQRQKRALGAKLDRAGTAATALWEDRGTPAENPLSNAGLRAGPRLSKTGVAALGDDLDHGGDQLLAQRLRVRRSPVPRGRE